MSFVDKGLLESVRSQAREGGTKYRDVEMLNFYWLTSPEAYRNHLPYPLIGLEDPVVHGFVANYPEVSNLFPYREYGLALVCRYRDTIGNYWLSMGLTDDMATFLGREIYGFPKKLAEIDFDKTGGSIECTGRRRGADIFRVKADLVERLGSGVGPELVEKYGLAGGDIPNYNFKELLSTSMTTLDFLPRLTTSQFSLEPRATSFADTRIELLQHPFDTWQDLPVADMLGGMYVRGDGVLMPGRTLKRIGWLRLMKYLPHMSKKYDRR